MTVSHPRARERRRRLLGLDEVLGFIPARAGASVETNCPVHPGARGSSARSGSGGRTSPGLSPRARGRHRPEHDVVADVGTIPAWAGETALPGSRRRSLQDHPRVGGGDASLLRPTGK